MAIDNCFACAAERIIADGYEVRSENHTCAKGTGTTAGREGKASAYTFDNYQQDTGVTAIYPDAGLSSTLSITYTILGLAGEAGELANKWKKYYRDAPNFADKPAEHDDYFNELRAKLIDELGDVLWYCSQLATSLGVNLGNVAADNIRKLNDRKQRNALHGSGDDR